MISDNQGAVELVQGLLNTSIQGVAVYQAVRDRAGAIVDLRLTMANAITERLLERPLHELTGQSIRRLFPTISAGRLARFYQVVDTGRSDRFQADVLLPMAPTTRCFDLTATRLADGLLITYAELRPDDPLDEANWGQYQLFRDALNTAVNAIGRCRAIRDDAGQVVDLQCVLANDRAVAYSGRSREDLLSQTLLTLYPDESAQAMIRQALAVVGRGEPNRYEYQARSLGRWFDVTMTPYADGIVISMSDVTEAVQQRQVIEAQNQTLRNVVENSLSAMSLWEAICDEQGRVVDFRYQLVNHKAARQLGRQPADLLGRRVSEVVPALLAEGFLRQCVGVYETGLSYRAELNHPAFRHWLDLSVTKVGAGLLLSAHDISPLKQQQHKVQEQAEFYRTILQHTQASIATFRPYHNAQGDIEDFIYVFVNEQVSRETRYPYEQLIGGRLLHLFPGARPDGAFDRFVTIMKTGLAQQFEMLMQVNGRSRWGNVSAARHGDYLVCSFNDITALKEAQLAQERQTKLLHTVLNSNQNHIIAFDTVRDEAGQAVDFRYVMQNEATRRARHTTDEQLLGQRLLDQVPAVRTNGEFERFRRVADTGQSDRYDMAYAHGGLTGYFNIAVTRRDDADGIVVTRQDKTDAFAAEQALRQQRDLLQRVVDESPAGMMLLEAVRDAAGSIVDFRYLITNALNAQLTGHTVDGMTGQLVSSLFPDYQSMALFRSLVDVTETGVAQQYPFAYDRYGVKGWFEGYFTQQGDGALFTFVDITTLQEQKQQIETANRELRHSNDSLEQFAYVASHDLQEPLRKIQSFGGMLERQYAGVLDAPGLDLLQRMQSAARRMADLISDLLTYSRITTQREPPEPVNLTQLLSDVLTDLDVRIRETNARITLEPLPTVPGNALLLRQLFQNLLSNALKFQPPGAQPVVQVRCRRADTDWQISVTDNGIGFDPKHADRIFDVFQRLHGKTKFEGTGVGLAICRRVAEQHGGRIVAQSEPGTGATFIVTLPA